MIDTTLEHQVLADVGSHCADQADAMIKRSMTHIGNVTAMLLPLEVGFKMAPQSGAMITALLLLSKASKPDIEDDDTVFDSTILAQLMIIARLRAVQENKPTSWGDCIISARQMFLTLFGRYERFDGVEKLISRLTP